MTVASSRAIARLAAIVLVAAARAAHADGDAARGEKRFEECVACHSTERGANALGPTLHGVFDRKAGELADYRYSPALKRSGITWTPHTMAESVAETQKMVPANRMPFAGLPDARERADLIMYLLQVFK